VTEVVQGEVPKPEARGSIPLDIVEQAIQWAIRLQYSEADAGTHRRFDVWLEADPRHTMAWQRVQSLNDDFNRMPANLALETLRTVDERRGMVRARRRQVVKALAFGGMSVVAASVGWRFSPWQRLFADASTGIGEQRTLRLQDGTTVVLNTDSAINVDLSGSRRLVRLRRGEILITTGHDGALPAGSRPFWVDTPVGSIRALGTRFVVRLEEDSARISVQAGAVELHPGGGTGRGIAEPGTSWSISATASEKVEAQPFAVDGWADGVISGTDMRLADLVAELARYRPGRVICDHRVADLRVSGAFRIGDTDRTLRFLSLTHPIRISYLTRFWVMVGPADGR